MQTIPKQFRQFVNSLPSAEQVRARLADNRQEAAFLRRLLKLAVEAEQSAAVSCEGDQADG